MAYLMTDVAAGGEAALKLQQSMAAAPYVEQQTAAAVEETQLKLQQERLKAAYAPQEAAAKAQQEEATLQKTKLANIVAQTGVTVTTDKSNAVKKLMEDPTWSTKNPSDQAMAIAAAWMPFDPDGGEKMQMAAANFDAKQLAIDLKKHDVNREIIGDAYATIKNATPEQITDLISKFPENIKTAIKSKIPGFFEQNNPTLQKAQLEALHLTASNENTNVTNQTRLLIAELQDSQRRSHDRTMEFIAEQRRSGNGTNQDSKLELSQWNAAQRAWSRVNTDFKKPIKEAEDAWKKSIEEDTKKTGVFSAFTGGSSAIDDAKTPEAKAELKSTKAWNELQKLKKERAQGKLDAIEGMPEGKEKNRLFTSLTKELESYDAEPPPPPSKKEVGAPSAPAGTSTPPAKEPPSMLDLLPGKMSPAAAADSTSKNVTSTKGNLGTKESPLPPPSDPSKLVDGMYYDLPGKGSTLYIKPTSNTTEPKPASVSATSVVNTTEEAQGNANKNLDEKGKPLPTITEKMIQKEIAEISAMPSSKGLSKKAIREIAIDLLNKRQDKL